VSRKAQRCTRCNQVGHNARTCGKACACGQPATERVGARRYCTACARLLTSPAKDELL